MNTTLHFSSDRQDWGTPTDFFERLSQSWGPFDLDVCATAHNAKCPRYFTPGHDGLRKTWFGTCWMNPPYGDAVPTWLKKARREVLSGHAECVVADLCVVYRIARAVMAAHYEEVV